MTGPALTQVGEAVGTPRYMSPEQLYGERADYRSDIFSLGVVLYKFISGQSPWVETDSLHELERSICDDEPSGFRIVAAKRFAQPAAVFRQPHFSFEVVFVAGFVDPHTL